MNFSDLLKLLQRPLALGKNQESRVRRLADIVTEEVDNADEFHNALGRDDVLKKYASGGREIGASFAASILGTEYGRYYPEGLIDRIDDLPSQVRRSLADNVRAELPSASEANIGELLANSLTMALAEAVNDPVIESAATQTQREASQKAMRRRALPLLMQQTGDLCAMPGCARTLFMIDDADNKRVTGSVRVIDPEEDPTALQNLAVLCSDCGGKYTGTNQAAKTGLLSAKRSLEQRQQVHALIIPTGLETQIRDVVASLAKVQPARPESAENWNAYEVRRKIATAAMLATKVEGYVSGYFDYIESTTKDLHQEGRLRFERVRHAFGAQYESLSKSDQSQEQVFDGMVDWLMSLTSSSRTPCEALVSYFVQICEVFRATP